MTITTNTLDAADNNFVLGETLRPLLTTRSDAVFFAEVASEVEMNPPDIAGVVRVAASHDIEFVM